MKIEPGEQIGGYRIIRLLGSGGMGAVYEAEHVGLGVRCALKVFTRERGDVEALRARFRAEGKILARLRHPNLVRVYDFGEDAERGVLYFVMDLVVGAGGAPRTLALVEPGEADETQLAKWYGELRSALEYIHSEGVVHRDFKPCNILVDEQGNAILGDFGISRFLDGELREELGVEATVEVERNDSRTVMGSVMFLAPEVRRGERATPAADAYALGVTFYRLLTGIWYEPGPVADGLLAEFGKEWRKALGQLLSEEPSARLPIPAVSLSVGSERGRIGRLWAVCAMAATALALTAVAVFVLRGRMHSVGPDKAGPPSRAYVFEDFFPSHTQQK